LTSVTVSVTVLSPTLEQSNSLGLIEIVSIPQASVLPLFIEAAESIASPLASSWIVNGAAHSA